MAGKVRVDINIGLDGHIALHCGATGQHLTLIALDVHQGERRGFTNFDIALEHLHLAGGAGAVAAGEW